jgi:prophage DNA circulation protein
MATAEVRDWLTTLWSASYKGVPFYFEEDKEQGGRDNVKHTFPHHDDPYIEDMGESLRFFSGSAYVHGDTADTLAVALKTALTAPGPGTLVVPYFGPVTVHCEEFERQTQRDRMGYVAFEVKFVRAGAATAFVSVPFLQNTAFISASNLATTVATLFPQSISTLGQPDHVVAGVTDTVASAAATIDVLRQQYPAAPAASAALRDSITALISSIPDAINDATAPGCAAITLAASLVQAARDLGNSMPAPSAKQASLALVAAFPSANLAAPGVPYVASSMRAAVNADAASRVARLAAMTAYAEAVLRMTFTARPDGVTARGEVSERFENELYDTTGAANAPLYLALDNLRFGVVNWLTTTINNLAPLITVESAVIRPSLDLAWILYADPTRSDELVARNSVPHPSFMPRVISALSR